MDEGAADPTLLSHLAQQRLMRPKTRQRLRRKFLPTNVSVKRRIAARSKENVHGRDDAQLFWNWATNQREQNTQLWRALGEEEAESSQK